MSDCNFVPGVLELLDLTDLMELGVLVQVF